MFGIDDERLYGVASNVYFWAVGVAAVSAGISFGAGLVQYITSNRIQGEKDRALREYQSNAGKQISGANERAALAEKSAADANNKTADLNNQTAQLEAENLRLKQQLAWRDVSPQQRQALIEAVRGFPGQHISVKGLAGDAECQTYAREIADALAEAGWDVVLNPILVNGDAPTGVRMIVNPGNYNGGITLASAAALFRTLQHNGIVRDQEPMRTVLPAPGTVVLIVGSKPMPN
ncbi:hypothetical protein [Burkholderia catarinensis]|uniref:hypothetical protein n=1 Tax=Burkholderia catarinensis TaxID=1108140 RepID=UPI000B157248|nr:hypothetical protein [Burkholderia catarinensis]